MNACDGVTFVKYMATSDFSSDTYAGGLTMLNSSAGVFGTRRIIIFRPSVDPMPIDASDRIDVASEKSLPDPLQSLNTKEFVRGNDNSVCNCGDVYDVVRCVVGVNEPFFVSTWVSVEANTKKNNVPIQGLFSL